MITRKQFLRRLVIIEDHILNLLEEESDLLTMSDYKKLHKATVLIEGLREKYNKLFLDKVETP